MIALLRFSVRHPRWVAAVSLVLALAAATLIPRVSLRLDARSLIPQGHPSMLEGDRAAERFGQRDVVVVMIASPAEGIYRPAALELLTELSRELEQVEGIVPGSVVSLATVPRLYVQDDVIDLEPLLEQELTPSPETALRVRHETGALGLDDGILASRDGRAAALYAEVERGADRSALGRRVRDLLARFQGRGMEIHFSGTAMAQAVLGEAAANDLVRQVPLVLAVVFLVMMLAFRHPVPALVSLAEVGVSLACTVALMGLLGQAVFVTTLALPIILIVIGVTDDVYALNRYFAELRRDPGRPVREVVEASFASVARPVALTAATTVTGLLSLALTALEPQRVFGLYGAVSVALSTLFTFTLLPALLVLLEPRTDPSRRSFAGRTEALLERLVAALRFAYPGRIAAGAALILAGAAALTGLRLRIEDNWIGNLPPSSSTVQGDRAINRLLAGTNTLDLMIDSGKPEGFLDPVAVAALGALEDALSASPDIGAVQSPFGEIARVNAALLDLAYRPYREALRCGERTLDRAEIEQALLLLASSGNSPGPARLDPEYRRARLTVFVRSANYSRMSAVLRLATETARRRFGPGFVVTPFGDGWIGLQSIRLLVLGQISSISFAVVANLALLVVLFRSLPTALVAIAPVIFSVLFVFGVLAAMDVPLGTANSMFAAIALGIGVDYSIHLVASFRGKLQQGLAKREALTGAMGATGPAILTSALAIIAGFSILTLSEVPPNRQLGLLISLSLAVCAVATLLLVPTLLLFRDRRTE
jgi:predicted RND superfamily exporter protein